jgi:hypothetical protein
MHPSWTKVGGWVMGLVSPGSCDSALPLLQGITPERSRYMTAIEFVLALSMHEATGDLFEKSRYALFCVNIENGLS